MLKWLRYSGMTVIIAVNPFHWSLKPRYTRFQDEWAGPKEQTWTVAWLFLTVTFWIDNGSW